MQLSVELKRDGDCLLDFKIPKAETQLVLFWCLCLTLWRVKYCQGWSSVRFVTLRPSSALSESHSQRYLLTIWQSAGDKGALSSSLPVQSRHCLLYFCGKQTSKLSERFR